MPRARALVARAAVVAVAGEDAAERLEPRSRGVVRPAWFSNPTSVARAVAEVALAAARCRSCASGRRWSRGRAGRGRGSRRRGGRGRRGRAAGSRRTRRAASRRRRSSRASAARWRCRSSATSSWSRSWPPPSRKRSISAASSSLAETQRPLDELDPAPRAALPQHHARCRDRRRSRGARGRAGRARASCAAAPSSGRARPRSEMIALQLEHRRVGRQQVRAAAGADVVERRVERARDVGLDRDPRPRRRPRT